MMQASPDTNIPKNGLQGIEEARSNDGLLARGGDPNLGLLISTQLSFQWR